MQHQHVLKIKGLYTSYNDLSSVPEGALLTADNIDVLANDIAQPRRGFDRLDAAYSSSSSRTDSTWFYGGKQFAHYGTFQSADSLGYYSQGAFEVATITCPATAGATQGDYFMLYNFFGNSYAVWLDIDDNGTAPTGANYLGADNQVEVDILTGDSAILVAQKVAAALEAILWVTVDNNGDGTITFTQQRRRATTNPSTHDESDAGSGSFTATVDTAGVSSLWETVGSSVSAPSGRRIQTLKTKQNLYFTTSTGIKTLDAYNAEPRTCGVHRALGPTVTAVTSSPTTTWFTDGKRVAYRVIFGYRDTNDNLVLGAPSERVEVAIAGANGETTVAVPVPAEIVANYGLGLTKYFFQVYRTKSVDTAATPSEEFYLVHEEAVDGTTSQTITDVTPESLTGATLYTSPSQEGIALANEQPPLAKTIAVFKDHVFFGCTTSKHVYDFALLGTLTSSGGLQDSDTITVTQGATVETYTAKATPSAGTDFQLTVPGGTVPTSQTIRDTAQALVKVINSQSAVVYAYYTSSSTDKPGQIQLVARTLGAAQFSVTSSRSTCWSPALPSSGTAESSSNDEKLNGIGWTKQFQPEHAPLAYRTEVGSSDSEVLAIVPLRDSLFIFKEDGGIYRLSGSNAANFEINLFDSSANLIGVNSPAVLNNQIWCLSDQGIVTVTETGVGVRSLPIEQDLRQLFASSLDTIKATCFGVAIESDRKYYCFLPSSSADTYPTQAYVFNTFTNAWTRHTLTASCGAVDVNQLHLGRPNDNKMWLERQNYSYRDYADFLFEGSISAISGTAVTLTSGADNVSVGDVIFQGTNIFAYVEAVDPITNTITVSSDPGLLVGDIDILTSIPTEIKWVPFTAGHPGMTKQFHTVQVLYKEDFDGSANLDFESDLSQFVESVPITGQGIAVWGLFPWGEEPWGGASRKGPIRQWVPRNKQRCAEMTVAFRQQYGYASFKLSGVVAFYTMGSDRTMR